MSFKSLFSFGDKTEEKLSPEIKLTGDMARACLETRQFKAYREQYQSLESAVIDELIREAANFAVAPDSVEKFGAKCLVKLTRLRDLRSLVSKVEIDSKKGLEAKTNVEE